MFWLFAVLYAALLPAILLSAFGIDLFSARGKPAAEEAVSVRQTAVTQSSYRSVGLPR
jgi:hypothetical protein